MVFAEEKSEEKPRRRLSFGLDVGRKSFDEIREDTLNIVKPSESEEKTAMNKDVRRRRSYDQLIAFSADGGTSGILKDIFCKDAKEKTAKEKMDILLIRAKRKGLGADKLFNYFDCNRDQIITAKEVRKGLYALDPILFEMTDAEIDSVVSIFDTNNDRTINMHEFEQYCFSLPDPSWRAERLRREQHAHSYQQNSSVPPPQRPESSHQIASASSNEEPPSTKNQNLIKSRRPSAPAVYNKPPNFMSTHQRKDSFIKMTASASAKQKLIPHKRRPSFDQSSTQSSALPKAAFK